MCVRCWQVHRLGCPCERCMMPISDRVVVQASKRCNTIVCCLRSACNEPPLDKVCMRTLEWRSGTRALRWSCVWSQPNLRVCSLHVTSSAVSTGDVIAVWKYSMWVGLLCWRGNADLASMQLLRWKPEWPYRLDHSGRGNIPDHACSRREIMW